MQTAATNLVRKQFMISKEQAKKLHKIAEAQHVSSAEILRSAIDAFNPDSAVSEMEESELLELVHSRVKDAIKSTKEARKTVKECLEGLSKTFVGLDGDERCYDSSSVLKECEEVRTYDDLKGNNNIQGAS